MSYNGSGVFNINTAGQPVVTGTVISSTAFNALTADLATGLTTALTKDGQTTPTANIPMGGFKITGIAAATTTGDALSYGRAATVSTLTNSALTSGRVPYASTAGLLVDSANLTFNGTTLTAAGFSGPISGVVTSTSITDSGLTSGRVTFASTGGLLADNTNLFWDNTNNRLGIGTSSPTTIFQVNTGTPVITISSTGTTASSQDFTTNSAAGKTKIGVEQSTGGGLFVGSSAYAAVFGSVGASNTQFASNNNVRMTIDTSGNVGIGITPTNSSNYTTLEVSNATNGAIFNLCNGATNKGQVFYDSGGIGVNTLGTARNIRWKAGAISGATDAHMTLDTSGNLLVGTTSSTTTPANGVQLNNPTSNSTVAIGHASGTATGNYYVNFGYAGTSIGNITQNGTTGVLYNLTSDYRLKNNQQTLTGAKDFIMALQPKKWQWWDGSGEGVGFVAHEFMEVAKHSGHGEKDAVDNERNPVYQSIQPSSSEVMANLISFVQELRAEVDALKSQLNQGA